MTEHQQFIVTARKWRPLRFSDVVGQEHVTTTLKNAILSNRVHHAYLFTGPRGVGKTTCARIIARALNCTHSTDAEPCNACDSCMQVLDSRNVDVIEIDGASNNSVDDVRKLRDNAKYAPMAGKYKMYIIDEVHMLSTAAFNALLKTLEEPPAHLVFVFATTEIHKVPATILSRCQRFDFRRMEIDSITGHLATIAKAEGITIDDESLMSIAKKADGSMRDSQSIFDQVRSFCGENITYTEVRRALHLIDVDFYFSISNAIKDRDVPAIIDLAQQVVQRGYDFQECLVGLLEHFRNLLTVIATSSTSLIEASATFLEKYEADSNDFSQVDVLRIMTLISQGEAILRQNPPQPRVRFEFTLIQLASLDSTVDLGKLLAHISTGSSSPSTVGGVAAPVRVRLTPSSISPKSTAINMSVGPELRQIKSTPTPLPTVHAAISSLSTKNLMERWETVIEELPDKLNFIRSSIRKGMLYVRFSEVGVVLEPAAQVVYHKVLDTVEPLKKHLTEVYGATVAVQVIPFVNQEVSSANGATSNGTTNGYVYNDDDLHPIEKAVIELFRARRSNTSGK